MSWMAIGAVTGVAAGVSWVVAGATWCVTAGPAVTTGPAVGVSLCESVAGK